MSKYYLSPKVVFTEEIIASNKPNSAPIVCILGSASRGPEEFTLIPNLKTLLTTYGTPSSNDIGLNAAAYLLQSDCQVLFGRTIPYGAQKAEVKIPGEECKFPWKITWKSNAPISSTKSYQVQVGFTNADKSTGKAIVYEGSVVKEEKEFNLSTTATIAEIATQISTASTYINLTALTSADCPVTIPTIDTYKYYVGTAISGMTEAAKKDISSVSTDAYYQEGHDAFPWVFTWKEYGDYSNVYSITVGTKNSSNPLDLTYQLRDADNVVIETFSGLCYQPYVANQNQEDYDEYEVANYITKNSAYVSCRLISPTEAGDADGTKGFLPTDAYCYYLSDINKPSEEATGKVYRKASKKGFTSGNQGSSVNIKKVSTELPSTGNYEIGKIYKVGDHYECYLPSDPYSTVPITKDLENDGVVLKDIFATVPARLEDLADVDSLVYDFLLIPGFDYQVLQRYAVAQVDSRGDAIYLPDLPKECAKYKKLYYTTKGSETVEESDLREFRNIIQALRTDDDGSSGYYNSRRVAIYYPNCTIRSNITGKQLHMPASVLGCFSHVKAYQNTGYIWTPGAGYSDQGAILDGVLSMDLATPIKVRDGLMSCSVNSIAYQVGVGYYVSGNETAFVDNKYADYSSLFCSLSISKTVNAIRRNVGRISRNFLYKPNTSATWASWVSSVSTYLDTIVVGNGLEKYRVVMDNTTVSEEDIKNHTAPGVIYIKPYRVIEYIPISVALTEDDFYFESEGEV